MPIALIAVSRATALQVQSQILGCEHCTDEADMPVCVLLDLATGRKGNVTDYVLSGPLKCPRCMAAITEETLVEG